MDPRVRTHAEIIADHSTEITPGDNVIIRAPQAARALVIALHEVIGERGGQPATSWLDGRAHRAYMLGADPEAFDLPEHVLAFIEATDVFVDIKAARNSHEVGDIPPAKRTAYGRVTRPIHEAQMNTRYVFTQFPTPGDAQRAEMSTEAYEEFVWSAINKDWEAQREFQEEMVEILDRADEVRIVSGDTTDIVVSIAGNPAKNDSAEINLPGGEVYTAPVPDSARGTVLFDEPLLAHGREIEGLWLAFEDGEVVDYSAETNEDVIDEMLNVDEGARRLGELGIGMNRDIDRVTSNMLFDEKMGDTVHLALGRAFEETVGEENQTNDSAIHEDLLVDMSQDSVIEVDGDVVQRDGTFVFEDGFETE